MIMGQSQQGAHSSPAANAVALSPMRSLRTITDAHDGQ
jgi:hypothetical protein